MFGDSSKRLFSNVGDSVYLDEKIREAQKTDKEIDEIKERMSKGKAKGFREDEHDTLWLRTAFMCLMTRRSGS